MFGKRFFTTLILFALLTVTFWGCSFFPGGSSDSESTNPVGPTTTGPVTGTITTGPAGKLAQQTVGAASTTIVVASAGSPLNGLSIQVPDGAFSSNVNFNVTSAVVKNQSFGTNFNPVAPVFNINNGGQTAVRP